jgi:hypothetical protein
MAFFPLVVEPLLADAPDMRRILVCGDGVMSGRIVIALIEAQVLGLFDRRLGAFDHDGFQGRGQ